MFIRARGIWFANEKTTNFDSSELSFSCTAVQYENTTDIRQHLDTNQFINNWIELHSFGSPKTTSDYCYERDALRFQMASEYGWTRFHHSLPCIWSTHKNDYVASLLPPSYERSAILWGAHWRCSTRCEYENAWFSVFNIIVWILAFTMSHGGTSDERGERAKKRSENQKNGSLVFIIN